MIIVKNMRKLLSLLLVAVMVMGLSVGVMAAGDASITIEDKDGSPTDGTFGSVAYSVYKIFDANIGENDMVSYTTSDEAVLNAIRGNATHDASVAWSDYFKIEETNESGVMSVTLRKEMTADVETLFIRELNRLIAGRTPDATGEMVKGETSVTISGLNTGYYLIVDSLGTSRIARTLGTATVERKNEYPTIAMSIVTDTEDAAGIDAEVGEAVTFKLAVKIPETPNGQDMVIYDKSAAELTVDPATVKAEAGVNLTTEATADGFKITIPSNAVGTNRGKTVTITYTGSLNGSARPNAAYENKAYLTYSNYTSAESVATVETYQLVVNKTNGDGQALGGAKFVLLNGEKFYKSTAGVVSWVDTVEEATELTTTVVNESAVVYFTGLKAGTYTLHETEAPAGYNIAADQSVEVSADAQRIDVINYSGTQLPATGGIGTTIFYVIGGVLVLGAGIVLVSKKRMSAGE